jgi:GTP-binding protein HflX
MPEVTGNTSGLGPGDVQMLERIYRRRVAPADVVGPELAAFLCECSNQVARQVGVLVDRRGQIEHVVVGDASKLMLPDVGRLRAARGRFRGLRLVHTHLRGEALTQDDLTDLALLRLDLVAAIGVERGGRAGLVHMAHLVPRVGGDGEPWRVLPPRPAHHLDLDFAHLIRSLEDEFARTLDRVASTDLGKDRALVVAVQLGRKRDHSGRVAELLELARSAGVRVLETIVQQRPEPDPRYLTGRGKLEQILVRAMQLGAELLIFDPDLTPGQARAISDFTDVKVIDRTMLILDIFAQRAQSRDGKLQVELAQLRYTLPRLVEKNTMMSRLTGGIGGRGPGETKLEINRRRARERVTRLEKQIEELSKRRHVRRERRGARDVAVVAVVGYTNAGKSTLFNALTAASVHVEDKLFATLDPTSRRLALGESGSGDGDVVLTDTVGFIRDLPPDLVNAFRATLEELDEADVLLHVVDASDPDHPQHIDSVGRILGELGLGERPRLVVMNKADRLPAAEAVRLAREHGAVAVSALNVETLPPLRAAIRSELERARPDSSRGRPRATSAASPEG